MMNNHFLYSLHRIADKYNDILSINFIQILHNNDLHININNLLIIDFLLNHKMNIDFFNCFINILSKNNDIINKLIN